MRRIGCFVIVIALSAVTGCQWFRARTPDYASMNLPTNNPIFVPYVDRNVIMDQVSDELDDYFRIKHEQRIRLADNILTEGWIKTYPQIGSSLIEPWRRDSTPGYEKLFSTLQTVRRFAKVRVIPVANGYNVDVKVYKELEDLPQPQNSNVSGNFLRHDNTLDFYEGEDPSQPVNPGWVPLGRDFSLEQRIAKNIFNRIQDCCER